jgi:site-specific recombinase XerD
VNTPLKSHARSNRELVESYERYLVARGNAAATRHAYLDAVNRLVDGLGAESVVDLDRAAIRVTLAKWHEKGLTANSIRLHVCALRSFFKFIRLTGLTRHDPMLLVGYRKLPTRLPVVLTVEQVERLIGAARDPFEPAVTEVLYSTGVRVSELVKLRLEDVSWETRTIRVHRGKGGKDRVVLFGSYAEKAMREYQKWRPSTAGFLFEAPPRMGHLVIRDQAGKHSKGGSWYACFCVDRVQRFISLGPVRKIGPRACARKVFERLAAKIPGYRPVPARPYTVRAIGKLCHRLAHRAKLGRVHPHALRRAMASHMLQNGGNLRVVQDLLGHEGLNTTMRYTWLDANHIKKVHEKCHPHEGGANAETDE